MFSNEILRFLSEIEIDNTLVATTDYWSYDFYRQRTFCELSSKSLSQKV